MKKYVLGKVLTLLLGLLLTLGLLFLQRKDGTIPFRGFFIPGLLCAIVVQHCRQLFLLLLDQVGGKVTENGHFSAAGNLRRYDFFLGTFSCTWRFYIEQKKLDLIYPLSLSKEKIETMAFPEEDKELTITYYRFSKILCGWNYAYGYQPEHYAPITAAGFDIEKPINHKTLKIAKKLGSAREKVMEHPDWIWPKSVVIFLLATGLFLGSVFIFLTNQPVPRETAIATEAVYQSCEWSGDHKIIYVYFEDLERQEIFRDCSNREMKEKLDQIQPGTEVSLYLHPDANIIMQITVNNEILLDYDETNQRIRSDRNGFAGLGVFMYVFAGMACNKWIRKETL